MGSLADGAVRDRFGRKPVIRGSILGAKPFALLLPHVDLLRTTVLSALNGRVLSSVLSAIVGLCIDRRQSEGRQMLNRSTGAGFHTAPGQDSQ